MVLKGGMGWRHVDIRQDWTLLHHIRLLRPYNHNHIILTKYFTKNVCIAHGTGTK